VGFPKVFIHRAGTRCDSRGRIWVSERAGNAMYRFDPANEKFERFGFPC